MTETTPDATPDATPRGLVQAGDEVHFLTSTSAWGYVRGRGESVVVDAAMIAASIDLTGASWLDRELDPDNPDPRIGRGPWPTDTPTWLYGDPEWEEAREVARLQAWTIADPKAQRDALIALRSEYGDGPPTSQTFSEWLPGRHPSEQAAARQEARLAAQRAENAARRS